MSEQQYEYALKIGNAFLYQWEEGRRITDDWDEAVGWLRDALRPSDPHILDEEYLALLLEKHAKIPVCELLKMGNERKPRLRIVKRKVGGWKTVKPEEGGKP